MIDNAKDLDILMPMCNLIEKIHNYSMVSGRWQNYYRNKTDDADANDSDLDGKSFEYKTKIREETPERPPKRGNVEVDQHALPPVPSLNILSLFPQIAVFEYLFYLPLISCGAEMRKRAWFIVLIEHHDNITGVKFMITTTKP